jgi:hypothetical protein
MCYVMYWVSQIPQIYKVLLPKLNESNAAKQIRHSSLFRHTHTQREFENCLVYLPFCQPETQTQEIWVDYTCKQTELQSYRMTQRFKTARGWGAN